MCDTEINTSDWNDAQFLTLCSSFTSWMANVLPSCWEITNNTLDAFWYTKCERAGIKSINWQLLLVVILSASCDGRCGERTDAAVKRFTSTWPLGKCLCPAPGELSQTQAVGWVEGLLPIDVTNFSEGCYGSLRMEWLRTNGVCFLAHGAGMVDRALIECALKERGIS